MDCHFLLQGIFLTQKSNWSLLHCRQYCLPTELPGKLIKWPYMSFAFIRNIVTCYTHKLNKEMATHSSTLTWKIPWMEELGRLQSMGSQRVRHNWATELTENIHWTKTCTLFQSLFRVSLKKNHETIKNIWILTIYMKIIRNLKKNQWIVIPYCLQIYSKLTGSIAFGSFTEVVIVKPSMLLR